MMIIISQDSNKMISIKDLSSINFKKIETDFEYGRDKNGYNIGWASNWEYVFYVDGKRFATYPKELKEIALEQRDMLIEAIKNKDMIFQFINISSATLSVSKELFYE